MRDSPQVLPPLFQSHDACIFPLGCPSEPEERLPFGPFPIRWKEGLSQQKAHYRRQLCGVGISLLILEKRKPSFSKGKKTCSKQHCLEFQV